MDEMEVIDILESAWFFSNVLAAKPINSKNSQTIFKDDPSSDSSEPTKPTTQNPQNEPKAPEIRSQPNSPQKKHLLTRRSIVAPLTESVISEVSRSPRRREEDERRRMRRRQRSFYSNRGICRGLNLEGEIQLCRGGELNSAAVLKDERTMKRHLKTWAMAVASSSVSQTTPLTALCC